MIGKFIRGGLRRAVLLSLAAAGIAAAQPYGLDTRASSLPYLAMPTTDAGVPALLSQTGAFDVISAPTLTPKPGLIPYTVISPFWSDGAVKTRYIGLPYDSNAQSNPTIAFAEGEWTFPNGTVFVKHFELVINEQTGAKRRLETRILVRDANGYVYGRSYRWRPDGSDADVVTQAATDNLEPITITQADGVSTRSQNWYYPKPIDCLQCHTMATNGVLGVKTRQQNGNFTYPSTGVTDNQLRTWGHLGMLDVPFSEGAIASYQKLVNVSDTSAPLVNRVRSYLDSNCSQCHRPNATGLYDARYDTPIASQMIFGNGTSGFNKLVHLSAVNSRIIQRDSRTSPQGGMPPLAKNTVDTNWIDTVTAFVNYPYDVTSVNGYVAYPTKMRLTFDRPVEPVSATTIGNYAVSGGIAVQGASLSPDGKTVTLTTSPMASATTYEIVVNNVAELQAPRNPLFPDTRRTFQLGALDPNVDGDDDGIPDAIEPQEGRDPFTRDNDVFGSARLFAMQQYRDFLGREGDASGVNSWVSYLNGGGTRAAVTEGFFGSSEFQGTGSPIARLYFAYFLRIPDYGGLTFWTSYFRAGHSLSEISDAFALSGEFTSRYGALTNDQFVNLVYQNVLNRAADAGGKSYWLGQLNGGMSRGSMMTGFSESSEYQSAIFSETYVTMMYVGMLKRAPDSGGFTFWVNYIDQGNSGQALINGFLVSQEYHNRFLP